MHKVCQKGFAGPQNRCLGQTIFGRRRTLRCICILPFIHYDGYVHIIPRGNYVGGDWRFMVGGNFKLAYGHTDTQRMLRIVVFFSREKRLHSIRLLYHLFAVLSCAIILVLLSCPMIRCCIPKCPVVSKFLPCKALN